MKKVAVIIAFKDFQDKEYFGTKEVLEKAGIKIMTVSVEKGVAVGAYGGEARIDKILPELSVREFDGIIFIGGPGALKYLDNEISYKIIKEAAGAGKILAAICISPMILAKAGILDGKKATVWSSPFDKGPIKILKDKGAEYFDKNVVVDGNIITANGPAAAQKFGEKIVEELTRL